MQQNVKIREKYKTNLEKSETLWKHSKNIE